jgi:hypothetical protein
MPPLRGGTDAEGRRTDGVADVALRQQKKSSDVVEPQVIDESLLRHGVDDPMQPDTALIDPIDFPQVNSLRLSFQNIIEISNLNNFDLLTTLRLDNNIIGKIENLDHLTNLTWLDLSFNNIREMENLDGLTKLTDLSLYSNEIETIKGLGSCQKLNILSLGRNKINDLNQIQVLRDFKNLRCLCMEGNPVCKLDNYNMHVLAYLPQLKYRDYMLLDKKEVKTAEETYQVDDLTELREQEQARANEAGAAEEKRQTLAQLRTAFLDATEDLFDELFPKEEEKKANLTMLQSYQNLKDEYKDVLDKTNQGSLMKSLRDTLLEKNAIRKKRVASFEKAIDAAELEAEEEAKKLVKSFRSRMKRAFSQVKTNPGMRTDALVEELVEQVGILREQLMSGETQVQEALEDANTKFEVQMAEIIKWMQERTGDFFRELEAHEKGFANQLTENMQNEYEQQGGQELMDSEGRALPTKDDMLQALQNFTEMHATLLANKEDQMTNQMKDWKEEFFKKHHERQYNRNRRRVEEISQIVETSREEIRTLEGNDMDDDAEDGADQ